MFIKYNMFVSNKILCFFVKKNLCFRNIVLCFSYRSYIIQCFLITYVVNGVDYIYLLCMSYLGRKLNNLGPIGNGCSFKILL